MKALSASLASHQSLNIIIIDCETQGLHTIALGAY